jgi:hypothetical protein
MKRMLGRALLAGLLSTGGTATANDIALFRTFFDTDWTFAGVGGLRGTGASSIALSGVGGPVSQAYLYWHGPTNSTDPTFNANITFAGMAIAGTNIGFSDDNFWGQANSQAYRADVTSLITGNGSYSIGGLFPSNSNGAQLIVFFDDGVSGNNRDVVLFDGNDGNFPNAFDADGWNVSLSGINYSGGTARMVLGVSDGQDFGPGDDGPFTVNGTVINPAGDVFEGATVPNTAGTTVDDGALWDIVGVDVTTLLSPGLNTLTLQGDAIDDALSLVSVAIDLPAGAAPPPPGVPAPASLALLGIGFAAWLAVRRRMT